MKRLRRFVLLGFVLMICSICLAGCMRLESTFRINKNGTVDMTMLLAALDDLDYENYSDSFPSMDSLKMWYMEDGWEVEEYKEDGYSGLIVKKQGNPIDDIDSTMKKAVIASGSDNSSFIEKQEDKYILDLQVFGEEQRERIADIKKYLKRFDGF